MFALTPQKLTPQPVQAPKAEVVYKLADLDLESELMLQFSTAKRLLAAAELDDGVPLNQKAQASNSITSVLATISKIRTELHSAERLKTLESTLIATLKEFPELNAAFLAAYTKALNV